MHEFEQMEDAALTALAALEGSGLKTLETYSGQLNAEELEAITLQFPCIYVVAGGVWLEGRNRYDTYRMELTLIVGDRNVRGSAAAARGDASSPGVYALVKGARDILHGVKLLQGWAPPVVTNEAPLVYAPEQSICIYMATYEMRAVK